MADRMYAEINIPAILIVGDVAEAVKSEFSIDDDELRGIISTSKNGVASFSQEEIAWGRFDLEDELVDLSVPFDRHSAPKYEYQAETRAYRPASQCGRPEMDATVLTDNDGEPYITCKELFELFDRGEDGISSRLAMKIAETAPHLASPLEDWAKGILQPMQTAPIQA